MFKQRGPGCHFYMNIFISDFEKLSEKFFFNNDQYFDNGI